MYAITWVWDEGFYNAYHTTTVCYFYLLLSVTIWPTRLFSAYVEIISIISSGSVSTSAAGLPLASAPPKNTDLAVTSPVLVPQKECLPEGMMPDIWAQVKLCFNSVCVMDATDTSFRHLSSRLATAIGPFSQGKSSVNHSSGSGLIM